MSRKNTKRTADTAFYIKPDAISEHALVLDDENFHHAINVLRQEIGAELEVVDGIGNRYSAVIERINKKSAICAIRSKSRVDIASVTISVGVGIPKSKERFEVLLEKVVELGATKLIPLQSERVQGRPFRPDRMNRIAIAAMKQSGRARLIDISEPQRVSDFAATRENSRGFVLSMEPGSPLMLDTLPGSAGLSDYTIAVGPEGGFTREEEDELIRCGFERVSLGLVRLRTETAAITAVAVLSQFANSADSSKST